MHIVNFRNKDLWQQWPKLTSTDRELWQWHEDKWYTRFNSHTDRNGPVWECGKEKVNACFSECGFRGIVISCFDRYHPVALCWIAPQPHLKCIRMWAFRCGCGGRNEQRESSKHMLLMSRRKPEILRCTSGCLQVSKLWPVRKTWLRGDRLEAR